MGSASYKPSKPCKILQESFTIHADLSSNCLTSRIPYKRDTTSHQCPEVADIRTSPNLVAKRLHNKEPLFKQPDGPVEPLKNWCPVPFLHGNPSELRFSQAKGLWCSAAVTYTAASRSSVLQQRPHCRQGGQGSKGQSAARAHATHANVHTNQYGGFKGSMAQTHDVQSI